MHPVFDHVIALAPETSALQCLQKGFVERNVVHLRPGPDDNVAVVELLIGLLVKDRVDVPDTADEPEFLIAKAAHERMDGDVLR